MKQIYAAILLTLPVCANAQTAQPYKLIVLRGNEGIAITDYPSATRCEVAREAIARLMETENRGREPRALPGGGMIVPETLILKAYCIPG